MFGVLQYRDKVLDTCSCQRFHGMVKLCLLLKDDYTVVDDEE